MRAQSFEIAFFSLSSLVQSVVSNTCLRYHAHGAEHNGRAVGRMGDVPAFPSTTHAIRAPFQDYTWHMHANQKLTNKIAGRTVSGVRQDGQTLNLDFSDGSSLQIKLADPASSVMKVSYAGGGSW